LSSIAEAIDAVVEKMWSSSEDVDDEMISCAQRLSEVAGNPPAPSWKKAVEILGITSRGELGRFAVYMLVGLAFSASIFVPAALFVGSTPASVLFPTVSTGVAIAGLLQAARHRQKD